MRRLAVTLFLVFYTFSVAGLTLKRTAEWASQTAGKSKKPKSRHGIAIAEAHKKSPHQVQTKLHEDSSVLISFLRTSTPTDFKTRFLHRSAGFIADQSSRAISSRAPPSFF